MKPRLLISVPLEPDGSVVVHLAAWLPRLRYEVTGWDIDISYVQEKPVAATRNRQTREFLKGPCDYLLTVDADAVPDTETLLHLLDDIRKPEVDAVSGFSFFVTPTGPMPVVQRYTDNGGWEYHTEILGKPPGLYEIGDGGGGAHCLMVKRATMQTFFDNRIVWFKDVLRDHSLDRPQLVALLDTYRDDREGMYREVERYITDTHNLWIMDTCGERMVGQDTWFCRRCHDQGLRLWMDTRVCWGHVKPTDLRAEYMEVASLREQLRAAEGAAEALKESA